MSNIAVLLGNEAFDSLIVAVAQHRGDFDSAVQKAMVEVIGQSIVHRNITPAQSLLDVMGSHLKPVLVAQFEKFGHIAYMKADKKLAFFDAKKEWTSEYRTLVEKSHWTKAKKEQEPKSEYDADVMLGDVIKRLDKLVAKPGVTVLNLELYKKVKAAHAAAVAAGLTAEIGDVNVSRDVQKQQAFTEKRKEDERNEVSGSKLEALAQHFNGAESKAA
jgi:hypothetical protein